MVRRSVVDAHRERLLERCVIPLVLLVIAGGTIYCQSGEMIHGVHQEHLNQFGSVKGEHEGHYDSLHSIGTSRSIPQRTRYRLRKEVYGFHPYWMGTVYREYDFRLLSGVAYFGMMVNPKTGSYSTIHFWDTTSFIDSARNGGSRVELTVMNFGSDNNRELLGHPDRCRRLIDSIIAAIGRRKADGVCLDFEQVPSDQKRNYVRFVDELYNAMRERYSEGTIKLTLPGIDWQKSYDIPALVPLVERFVMMGYDYYYSHSPTAGPVAPMVSGGVWDVHTVETSIDYYLNLGVPPEKLLLGVPYYGKKWRTSGKDIPAKNEKYQGDIRYSTIVGQYRGKYTGRFDTVSLTPYLDFRNDNRWHQLWYDDSVSLGYKYDLVYERGLAGVYIWALGYDNGYRPLWNLLHKKFAVKDDE